MDNVRRGGPFPNVPLVVLTGKKKILEGARFREIWLQTQKALAALSSDSTHKVCSHCGHYVHKDDSNLVVTAVTSVVEQARGSHTDEHL